MASGGYREEVLNVLLALLLHRRGIVAAPERSFQQLLASEKRRHVPDVLVIYQGLRTVIEGKVNDQANARTKAFQEAQERVNKGIAHIGVAVLYPSVLRQNPFPDLVNALARSQFQIAVCSEAGETNWTEGGLDYLADLLQRTFHQLVQEDVVARAVETLNAGISEFARSVFTTPARIQRAAQILGIGELPRRRAKEAQEEE